MMNIEDDALNLSQTFDDDNDLSSSQSKSEEYNLF